MIKNIGVNTITIATVDINKALRI
ncbi:hypothetical protein D043_4902A, partial [Vibrio parahaemolyticus EKP-021]